MSRVRLLQVLGGFYAVSTLLNNPRRPNFLLQNAGISLFPAFNTPSAEMPKVTNLSSVSFFAL